MTPINSARLPGLAVSASAHSGGTVMPWHTHDGATVCCVLDGAFTEYWRGHALECSSATVKVTPAGEPHWNRFGAVETRGLMVEVEPQVFAASRGIRNALDSLVHVSGGELAFLSRRIWRELGERDAAAPLALEGLVLELIAGITRQALAEPSSAAAVPPWLRAVRERLHEQLDPSLSLQTLAAEAGVHPSTLTRAFRRAYGCPPGEYLRRLRLERAAHEVMHGDRSLAEIAIDAGYADQAHFTRAFKRATGWTPGEYRRA
ncbi:MAG TPA: AraC family transcriptional regulator [Gemmatimonadales bacterium]|nr:AraC family transcriptional regulator [Gemmatimonadales bacterium]